MTVGGSVVLEWCYVMELFTSQEAACERANREFAGDWLWPHAQRPLARLNFFLPLLAASAWAAEPLLVSLSLSGGEILLAAPWQVKPGGNSPDSSARLFCLTSLALCFITWPGWVLMNILIIPLKWQRLLGCLCHSPPADKYGWRPRREDERKKEGHWRPAGCWMASCVCFLWWRSHPNYCFVFELFTLRNGTMMEIHMCFCATLEINSFSVFCFFFLRLYPPAVSHYCHLHFQPETLMIIRASLRQENKWQQQKQKQKIKNKIKFSLTRGQF